ncbi:MAG: hypothetical protein SGI72_18150 [Planctomycetota bacterium]|nr:hypothetical protein [Planctomycetota bacterium]
MNSAAGAHVEASARLRGSRILVTALVLLALWIIDAFVLRTGLLAPIHGRASWTPLYAVPEFVWRPQALIFAGLAGCIVWLAPRTCAVERWSSRRFTSVLALVAAAASFALFLVRQDASELGALFDHYRDEEFVHDARAIVDPALFFGNYVDVMPQLSTHGRHFPPGPALLLYALGGSALAAGIASVVGVAVGCVFAYRAVGVVFDEPRARTAAWMILTAPALLDFGAASMDAVFFAFASLALWLGLRALGPTGTTRGALLAGVALFAAALFSFSSAMIAIVLALYACFRVRHDGLGVVVRWMWIGFASMISATLVWFVSGFSLWDCGAEAVRSGHEFMEAVMARSQNTDRARLFFGNGVAFAISAGVGTIAALGLALGTRANWMSAWTRAVLATVAVMCALYYLETERIWLFALPWIAVVGVAGSAWDAASLRRLLAANLAQAWALEVTLFTLW